MSDSDGNRNRSGISFGEIIQLVALVTVVSATVAAAAAWKTIDLDKTKLTNDVVERASNKMLERPQINIPLGTIVAWHKNITGMAKPPKGWVECKGGFVQGGSLDGEAIPDLNVKRRFLRGAMKSGPIEDHAIQGHAHKFNHNKLTAIDWNSKPPKGHQEYGYLRNGDFGYYFNDWKIMDPISIAGFGDLEITTETRPINMSVVWIIWVNN